MMIEELCQTVDVVCVCAPNDRRLEVMQAVADAADKGIELKGIICEKPLAQNLAEDYAQATIIFKDPASGMVSMAQAANSWMYDAPGLRILMEAMGPGYAYTVDTLQSPAGLFISDTAAAAVADGELALEKSQSTQGALILQPNEPDLYGYVAEWRDAAAAFEKGEDALLNLKYGRLITLLVMAGYMSHEQGRVIDLTDQATMKALNTYVPLIQQGNGTTVLAP